MLHDASYQVSAQKNMWVGRSYLMYLRRRKEAFLSFVFTWPIQINFCSWRHMVWRKMLLEEYQNCCLVLGHPDIWINELIYSEPPYRRISAQEDVWFGRRNCLKISMMAIQGLCFTLVFAQMDIWLGKRYFWSTEDSCHGGTTQWFCWLWVYNP